MNKSFFVLLIVPPNWYVRFMLQTTKVCHQKLNASKNKGRDHEELLERFPPYLLLSPSYCSCQQVGALLGTRLAGSSTLVFIISVGLKVNLEPLVILPRIS